MDLEAQANKQLLKEVDPDVESTFFHEDYMNGQGALGLDQDVLTILTEQNKGNKKK